MTRPLVVLQIALSVLVLSGTWTIAGYATKLAMRDDVVDASAITVGRLALDATAYPTPERRVAYYDALRAHLAGHPALAAVTIATAPPFAFADLRPLTVDGVAQSDTEPVFVVGIGRSYFETIGLPIVRGRRLEQGDEQVSAQSVVVNERFAARYFGESDPLSRRIQLGANRYGDPATNWMTVVGVATSVRQAPIQDLQPVVYVPLPSERRTEAFVLAKAAPGATAGPVLREAVAAIDEDVPLYNLTSLDHISRMSRWTPRIFGAGLSVAGLVALLLSTVHGDRKTMAVADRHDLGALATACWTDRSAPFFAEAKVASTKASLRSIFPRGRGGLRRGAAAAGPSDPSAARVESDGGRSGRADSAPAGRAMERPCAAPRARRSAPPADRSTGAPARPHGGEDGRSVRARPTGRRSGPYRRVRRRSY